MSKQFFSGLSQNYMEILEDNEYYDVTIEVDIFYGGTISLMKYLIKYKYEWMEQHFELIYQTGFQSNSLLNLQNFCTGCMTKSPHKIFNSFDFTSLSEKSLVSLIKKNDLQMK
ncbi:BTB/POZ protein [Rhizophagus irregularis DAOM 181602=DAOM 197198]|uniref:Uncharacterized protein n=1 Tax=Rhizophagus irregularis (strain DAOM 181602 / DAOM 197198 / MUCL 43194) TaxID=747089 RepID=A0A2P4PQR4_RHIID|nr:hypothetical protein GLOIN_2v1779094 [Rhizophagus irregularis DAOM 181602=DAOM 197198]POG67717.1 hypothetical protein GLOIN_2v1779094 [Rhizophagus irregularis DAOM 181602=DAOM 197198]GBC40651.2 BTB/POZ protein [Rhizophagus irregularis DAOM 181602=DAOM 197198]|eukprot:XP_025174583.1 hypothetical protein GLOIN_2v1779094 [Rhizophagus irregularis DAOM 181602=DAOM 197198]